MKKANGWILKIRFPLNKLIKKWFSCVWNVNTHERLIPDEVKSWKLCKKKKIYCPLRRWWVFLWLWLKFPYYSCNFLRKEKKKLGFKMMSWNQRRNKKLINCLKPRVKLTTPLNNRFAYREILSLPTGKLEIRREVD